jgi:enterochelin esterase-like enzyme
MTVRGPVELAFSRRAFAGAAAGLAVFGTSRGEATTPESSDLELRDLRLPGEARVARRALVLVPKHVAPGTRLPVLVLLHGKGEAGNELAGIHAWGDRYGLVRCYERLRRPPIERVLPKANYLTNERRAELNASLGERPFRGLILVCPVTPNPHELGDAPRVLDRYTAWLADTLLPAVREVAPVASGPHAVGLDGCSMGGYVALEVFLRRPELFGSLGTIQGAFGRASAELYARRLARALEARSPCPIHLASSSEDPFRDANELLAARLTRLGIPNVLRVPPGPHNQPWLREVGTLELLLWHDRVLF